MGKRPATSMHVALLRSINVGGKNKLPMKELTAIFVDAGCSNVRTYIQSGNVVFTADKSLASRVPALVSDAIAHRFGYQVPVVTRTASELIKIVAENPFIEADIEVDIKTLHVAFLARRPSGARAASLDPGRSPPDEFVVRGREIYLCCPMGIGKSKLTNAYFDLKLGTTTTLRNWKTVLKLGELAGGGRS